MVFGHRLVGEGVLKVCEGEGEGTMRSRGAELELELELEFEVESESARSWVRIEVGNNACEVRVGDNASAPERGTEAGALISTTTLFVSTVDETG